MKKLLKFLWSKKWYTLIILLFSIICISLSIKLFQSEKHIDSLNEEFQQYSQVIKENNDLYSNMVFLTDNFTPIDKSIKKYINGDPVVQIKTKIITETVTVEVPSNPVIDIENECPNIAFNFNDDFLTLEGLCKKESTSLKYSGHLSLETYIQNNKGILKTFHKTNNPNIIIESSSVTFDKDLIRKSKNNIIQALIGYNLNKKDYSGTFLGVQYIREFDSIPLTVGGFYQINFEGQNTVGISLGGRF